MNHENIETIKQIKHQFMVYRNGIVADTLRDAGMPYHVIFGLQLPQLAQIARSVAPSLSLANDLWADDKVRESRLLACYLFPKESITLEQALALARSVQTVEEADIICFSLLRYLPFAEQLVAEIPVGTDNPSVKYCATALRRNLDAMA